MKKIYSRLKNDKADLSENFYKIFNHLQINGHIRSVIYNKKDYNKFHKWFEINTGQDSNSWLDRYLEGKVGKQFPFFISISDSGNIGHQGGTSSVTFKERSENQYKEYMDLPLDVICNINNYPEYSV